MEDVNSAVNLAIEAIEAIKLYHVQYDQVDKLWGYFSAVTLAISGFVVGTDRSTRSIKEPISILIIYWFFSFGNYHALVSGQKQLEQLANIAIIYSKDANLDISSFQPLSDIWVGSFQIGIVVIVSVGILLFHGYV